MVHSLWKTASWLLKNFGWTHHVAQQFYLWLYTQNNESREKLDMCSLMFKAGLLK